MKKAISFAAALCILSGTGLVQPTAVSPFTGEVITASAVSVSGEIGEPDRLFLWEISDSGAFTLTGSGALPSYDYFPWEEYKEQITSVEIGSGITTVGTDAFQNCKNLREVSFPDTLTEIMAHAFEGCSSLTSVVLPEGVENIGSYAFYDCPYLAQVNLPDSITRIGSHAFAGTALTSVHIPRGLDRINANTFGGCTALESVNVPANVTAIDRLAFYGCTSLSTLTIAYPGCVLGDRLVPESTVICGRKGSTAQSYAEENGLEFMVQDFSAAYTAEIGEIILIDPPYTGEIAWVSDDVNVAAVSGGRVRALAPGTAYIYAVSPYGTETYTVTVIGEAPAGALFGDINSDGLIDANDASVILTYYAYTSTGGTASLEAFLRALEG